MMPYFTLHSLLYSTFVCSLIHSLCSVYHLATIFNSYGMDVSYMTYVNCYNIFILSKIYVKEVNSFNINVHLQSQSVRESGLEKKNLSKLHIILPDVQLLLM